MTPSGRILDALVAEHCFGWERATLRDHVLDIERFRKGEGIHYKDTGQTTYLCRPGRLQIREPVGARELIGNILVGGDEDLPRYSTTAALVVELVERYRLWIRPFYPGPLWTAAEEKATTIGDWAPPGTLPEAICWAALLAAGVNPRVAAASFSASPAESTTEGT